MTNFQSQLPKILQNDFKKCFKGKVNSIDLVNFVVSQFIFHWISNDSYISNLNSSLALLQCQMNRMNHFPSKYPGASSSRYSRRLSRKPNLKLLRSKANLLMKELKFLNEISFEREIREEVQKIVQVFLNSPKPSRWW